MKIVIECESKEIAELLSQVKTRHKITDLQKLTQDIMKMICLPNTEFSTTNEREIHAVDEQ